MSKILRIPKTSTRSIAADDGSFYDLRKKEIKKCFRSHIWK